MAHQQEILDTLAQWQSKSIREADIHLSDAANSFRNGDPTVEARPGNTNSRWVMYRKGTGKVAVFTYVGIWAWSSDLETGNFVPPGCEAPEHLPENRLQDSPSYRCELAYAFDTATDASLWDDLSVLEGHVLSQSGFNKGGKPRRGWQNGRNPAAREKYVLTSKLFAKKTPYNTKDGGTYKVSYKVHPWIALGVETNPQHIPNPDRAKYYDSTHGTNRKLEDTDNPKFLRNDIVLVTFKLGFVVGGDAWGPELVPIEFLRLGRLPEHVSSQSDPAVFPSLDADFVPLEVGTAVVLFEKPVRNAKRKLEATEPSGPVSSEDGILLPSKKQAINPDTVMLDLPGSTSDHDNAAQATGGTSWGLRSKDKNKENRALRA